MFAEKALINFFPTPVWVHDLKPEEHRPMNAALAAKVDALIAPRPSLGPGENWQTHQNLHELPEFAGLVDIIKTAVDGCLDYLKIHYEGYAITGCWANLSPPGVGHPGHSHPNNYLSGVYYVKVPRGGDSITFNDPRVQTTIMAPHVKQADRANAVQAALPVREGRLIVFPAWLVHSVEANRSREERLSIAFNIMFTQYAETMAHPLWRSRFAPDTSP